VAREGHGAAAQGFGTRQVARIVGIPPRRVRRCVGAGLLRPDRDRRGRLRFDFRDLVQLRFVGGLLEKGVPLQRIAELLRSLKLQVGDRPLSCLHVDVDGRRVVARDGSRRWHPEGGQLLFDFHGAGGRGRGATQLVRLPVAQTSGGGQGVSADDWCDLGLEIEEDAPSDAREAYRRAIDLEPEHVAAHLHLGRLLEDEGDAAAAEHHYRIAIAADPDNPHAWFQLGALLERGSLSAEAIYCYERTIQADSQFADGHYHLALLYDRGGCQRDAARHLAIFRRLIRRR